jgi:hypothetical protein
MRLNDQNFRFRLLSQRRMRPSLRSDWPSMSESIRRPQKRKSMFLCFKLVRHDEPSRLICVAVSESVTPMDTDSQWAVFCPGFVKFGCGGKSTARIHRVKSVLRPASRRRCARQRLSSAAVAHGHSERGRTRRTHARTDVPPPPAKPVEVACEKGDVDSGVPNDDYPEVARQQNAPCHTHSRRTRRHNLTGTGAHTHARETTCHRAHARTHAHACTRTRAHARTHTHAHTNQD